MCIRISLVLFQCWRPLERTRPDRPDADESNEAHTDKSQEESAECPEQILTSPQHRSRGWIQFSLNPVISRPEAEAIRGFGFWGNGVSSVSPHFCGAEERRDSKPDSTPHLMSCHCCHRLQLPHHGSLRTSFDASSYHANLSKPLPFLKPCSSPRDVLFDVGTPPTICRAAILVCPESGGGHQAPPRQPRPPGHRPSILI